MKIETSSYISSKIHLLLRILQYYNIIENGKLWLLLCIMQVHIGWISKKIPSLQLLCRLKIHKTLQDQTQVDLLPIPCRLKNLISSLFTHSIKAS